MSKLRASILLSFLATGWVGAGPANDDFANRIFLEGSSATLTANMEEATRDPDEVSGSFLVFPTGTAWWSWTAPSTGPVIIQVLKVLKPSPIYQNQYRDYVAVWHPGNLGSGFPAIDFQSPQPVLSSLDFDAASPGYFLVFTGYVGNTYQIQLGVSRTDASYTLALTATNAPLIFGQPRDARIAPGQCALFTVDAAGVLPLSYQWQFNDESIMGANSSFYGITNGTLPQAGDYSVVVSNATGISTSLVAHLWISLDEVAPSVNPISFHPSEGFQFALQGELGRFYRVETSANLRDWLPEQSFPWDAKIDVHPYPPRLTSIVLPKNLPASYSVSASNAMRFVRVSRYAPSNEVCNLFLAQIRHAKNAWARETRRTLVDTPGDTDIFTIQPGGKPRCPSGGFYFLNSVGAPPQCSYGHALEEPR